jgi:hypothetical protein
VDDRTGRPLRPAHVESFLQLALLSTQGIFYSLVGLWVRAGLISAVVLHLNIVAKNPVCIYLLASVHEDWTV